MALGKTLTNLRKEKGLSQEQLAEKLDLTRQTISKWELDQSTPDIEYLLKLSEMFDVSTDYLIKGGEPQTVQASDAPVQQRSEPITQTKEHTVSAYKWCFCFGTVVTGASLIGIIAFVICAAVKPHIAWVNGTKFTGLLGFLNGTQTTGFFIVLCFLSALGVLFAVYGIVKDIRSRK